MIPLKKVIASTVGRKFIMALTGVGLVMFIVIHLLGNLQLLLPTSVYFNKYAAKFHELGPLLPVVELGLASVIFLHAIIGIILWRTSAEARNSRYAMAETKGGDSRWNLSSRHMLLLGVVLLAFMILHVAQFRFEAFSSTSYVTVIDGHEVRDLHRLVVETFQNPLWVMFYMGVMLFLGLHLRHGVWSMFQSVGAMPGIYSKVIYLAGAVLAVALALGFFILPIYLYLFGAHFVAPTL